MICEGTFRHVIWNDQWTATTKDGRRSAQFEHTLLITPTGVEALTGRLPTSNPFFWEADDYTTPATPIISAAPARTAPRVTAQSTQPPSEPTKGFSAPSATAAKKKAAAAKKVASKKKRKK